MPEPLTVEGGLGVKLTVEALDPGIYKSRLAALRCGAGDRIYVDRKDGAQIRDWLNAWLEETAEKEADDGRVS